MNKRLQFENLYFNICVKVDININNNDFMIEGEIIMGKRIKLETYREGLNLAKNNGTSSCFTVPVEWLLYQIEEDNLEDFLDTYTYDESFDLKRLAKEDGVFKYATKK